MELCQFDEQKEINSMLKENSPKEFENNEHFYMKQVLFDENKQIIGYDWIYQYENYQIVLEYYLSNRIWNIISLESHQREKEILNCLLDDLNYTNNLSLDQQIQIIIQRFDHHFYELKQGQLKISSILKQDDEDDDDEIVHLNHRSSLLLANTLSTPSTILEVDEEQIESPNQLLTPDCQLKFDCLTPPITPTRTRLDSSCSSTNSIKYTQFIPPLTLPVRRRRVIQSIFLRVQRKKKVFENLVGQLKQLPKEPTMSELGLEFLRVYDGKFNYPVGHTFIMSFVNRTWFLTIENIKCVECELGQSEPRSLLILKYKNKFTTVQV